MKTWQRLRSQPHLWDRYFIRENILWAIRNFFRTKKFHEVETPLLTGSLLPESYLDVFETTLLDRNRVPTRAFLPTSPEVFLKKLLVAGIGNCFSLTKSFRNTEDKSNTHMPEFTILEWYRVNADYTDIMRDCEELIGFLNTSLHHPGPYRKQRRPSSSLVYQGKTIDLSLPWERMSVSKAFRTYAGVELERTLTRSSLLRATQRKGYRVGVNNTWEELFHLIFLNEVEPKLGRGKPTILYDYPVSLAALSQKKKSDPRFAERFEFYIEGLELGDAYSELTDWKEQGVRFRKEQQLRRQLGKVDHPTDTDFIDALKTGMPQAGGIAVGVDRLVMLLSDTADINDTLLFPIGDLFSR